MSPNAQKSAGTSRSKRAHSATESFRPSVRPRTTSAIAEAEEDSLESLETLNDSFRTAAEEEEDSVIGSEELEEGEGGAMDGEERGREFLLIWGAGHLPPLGYTCPVDVSHR